MSLYITAVVTKITASQDVVSRDAASHVTVAAIAARMDATAFLARSAVTSASAALPLPPVLVEPQAANVLTASAAQIRNAVTPASATTARKRRVAAISTSNFDRFG